MKNIFKCVMCNGILQNDALNSFVCDTCGRQYPIINDIPILVARHNPALLSIGRYMESQLNQLNFLRGSLSKLDINNHNYSVIDIDRMLKGMERNLYVMEQHCKPVLDYLRKNKNDLGNIDWFFSMDPGLSFHKMLRYFYQDWYGTTQFNQVNNLVTNAISTYCNDDETLAVLGCGACGLLHSLANKFSDSYGVDLAIPALMTAQQFLNGEDITVYLEDAEWKEVHLEAKKITTGKITLVASNVMNLPFEDCSISAIVTQYMMDLEGNHPCYLTDEINRVLKPEGIWINFSMPFRVPSSIYERGPITIDKLPEFINSFGFELMCSQQQRFKPWNFEAVTETGDRPDHEVHFYVAKKVRQFNYNKKLYMPFIDYFAGKNNRLWGFMPEKVEGRTIAVISKTEFRSSGTCQTKLLNVAFSKVNVMSFPITRCSSFFDLQFRKH